MAIRVDHIARELGDLRGEASVLSNLGTSYRALGRIEEAVAAYKRALLVYRELGDLRGEGTVVGNLGIAFRGLGQIEEAKGAYERALAIDRELGDRRGEAFDAWNLGLLYEESDPARAVELMSVCVDYEREIGHPDADKDAERVEGIRARGG